MKTLKATVSLSALAYILILFIFLFSHNFKIGSIICLGETFCKNRDYYFNIPVLKGSTGYDGQFYYRLALDPFCKDMTIPIAIDAPAYRQQRILFPLIVKAFSFWNYNLIPYVMVAVNSASILLLSLIVGLLAQANNRSPLWGFVFVLYPGFIFSLFRALPEPFMALWMVLALYALHIQKNWVACLALCCAVLARETSAVLPLCLGSMWIYARIKNVPGPETIRSQKLYVALIPLLCLAVWQIYLFHVWGYFPFSRGCAFGDQGTGHFQIPLTALYAKVAELIGATTGKVYFFESGLLGGFFMTGIFALTAIKNRQIDTFLKITFLAYLVMASLYSKCIWEYHGGFLRALIEFYLLGNLVILFDEKKWILRVNGFVWIGLFLLILRDLRYY